MRTTVIVAFGALLVTAGAAHAQQDVIVGSTGSTELGFRMTDVTGDRAKFDRYRDLSDGAFVEGFRFDQRGTDWRFNGLAEHLGRRDQKLFAEINAKGRIKASFTWDQIPLFVSGDTRTLYRAEAPGVLRLDDALQLGIEEGRLTLADAVRGASPFDLRSKRQLAAFDFTFHATPNVDVTFNIKDTRRQGVQAQGAALGFSDATEVAAPIDTRTTDVKSGVEWASDRGSVRLDYDGSWFDNRIPALVWDNPLKLTDSTSSAFYISGLGASQGRLALPPSNSLQSVGTAASMKLPAHSRVSANVTVGAWRQNDALIPATINSAIAPITLPRETAEAEAKTLAMNYSFTSRPHSHVWLNARYRYYDFDNRTAIFDMPTIVVVDQNTQAGAPTKPFGSTRQDVELDASVTPTAFSNIRFGYSRNATDRNLRIFARTVENTLRTSVDASRGRWLVVRAIGERSQRVGQGYDPAILEAQWEQPTMRHFDIADRNRLRATVLVQVMPIDAIGFSVSTARGWDKYENSGFGLRDNQNRSYSVSIEAAPSDRIAASVAYTIEHATALQTSRTGTMGTPNFSDPARDWSVDFSDRVETLAASVDLSRLLERVDIRFAFDYSRSDALYLHRGSDDEEVEGGLTLMPLPPVINELQGASGDVRFALSRRVSVGALYLVERYSVENFAQGTAATDNLFSPGALFLGSQFRSYNAKSASIRLICTW